MKISKTFILLGVCLLIFNSSTAQEELDQLVTQQFVNLLPLSYNIELPVGGRGTFVMESGLDLAFFAEFSFGSGGSSSSTNFAITPFVELNYRNYYRLKSRSRRGKVLFLNSGNYFFGTIKGNIAPIISTFNIESNVVLGGGWGMQRIYKSNIIFNFGIGGGYYMNSDFPINWLGDFGVGLMLGRKLQSSSPKFKLEN
jgi:hypothetical protein